MNPLTLIPLPWKIGGALALIAALAAAGVAYHHYVYQQGVSAESSRRDAIEAANSARANKERDALNTQIAAAQTSLTVARASLAKLEKDFNDEKAISDQRRRDLLSGAQRMRINVRPGPADPNRPPQCGPAGDVDQNADIVADISGPAAAAIDQLLVDHNAAVDRLQACIVAYDSVKAAADAMP